MAQLGYVWPSGTVWPRLRLVWPRLRLVWPRGSARGSIDRQRTEPLPHIRGTIYKR